MTVIGQDTKLAGSAQPMLPESASAMPPTNQRRCTPASME